jgi:hypothetical protein
LTIERASADDLKDKRRRFPPVDGGGHLAAEPAGVFLQTLKDHASIRLLG